MFSVPPESPGYTPNRNGTVFSGAIDGMLFQNENAASKPGRTPPLRCSTTSDHRCPRALNTGGNPVPQPVPSPGSTWVRTRFPYAGTNSGGTGAAGNVIGAPANAAAVTLASRK